MRSGDPLREMGDRFDQRNLSAAYAMKKVGALQAYKERRHIIGSVVGRNGSADPYADGYGPSDVGDDPKVRAYEQSRAAQYGPSDVGDHPKVREHEARMAAKAPDDADDDETEEPRGRTVDDLYRFLEQVRNGEAHDDATGGAQW